MSIQILPIPVSERSTKSFLISFRDEPPLETGEPQGSPIVPDSIEWSLVSPFGDIINEREDVSVTPDSDVTIVLSDLDLAISDIEHAAGESVSRILLVKYTATIEGVGEDLPFNLGIRFYVEPLPGITND